MKLADKVKDVLVQQQEQDKEGLEKWVMDVVLPKFLQRNKGTIVIFEDSTEYDYPRTRFTRGKFMLLMENLGFDISFSSPDRPASRNSYEISLPGYKEN